MSGFEIIGAAAAALQFAEAAGKAGIYIYRFIQNGKEYNEKVAELRVKLEYFKSNLENFSTAARTIRSSEHRSQDETVVYSTITDNLDGSYNTLNGLFTCYGALRRPGTRSSIKLAVKYWCYQHKGQKVVDRGLSEIGGRVDSILGAIHSINLMVGYANRDLGHKILNHLNGRPNSTRHCSEESNVSDCSLESVFSQVSRASTTLTLYDDDFDGATLCDVDEKWDLKLLKDEDPMTDTLELSQDIIAAIEDKKYKVLRNLLQKGQDPFAENDDGWCALHFAARKASQTVMQELLACEKLKKNKELIDKKDNDGVTALHFAASLGAKNMVKELIKAHADINAVDDLNQSPLYIAVERDREETFEILWNAGAKFEPSIPKAAQRILNNIEDRKAILGR